MISTSPSPPQTSAPSYQQLLEQVRDLSRKLEAAEREGDLRELDVQRQLDEARALLRLQDLTARAALTWAGDGSTDEGTIKWTMGGLTSVVDRGREAESRVKKLVAAIQEAQRSGVRSKALEDALAAAGGGS